MWKTHFVVGVRFLNTEQSYQTHRPLSIILLHSRMPQEKLLQLFFDAWCKTFNFSPDFTWSLPYTVLWNIQWKTWRGQPWATLPHSAPDLRSFHHFSVPPAMGTSSSPEHAGHPGTIAACPLSLWNIVRSLGGPPKSISHRLPKGLSVLRTLWSGTNNQLLNPEQTPSSPSLSGYRCHDIKHTIRRLF